MILGVKTQTPLGTSLRSLVQGFVLTKQTEGKSPKTVEYYRGNLRRFLWYAEQQDWSGDARVITEWNIREFAKSVRDLGGRCTDYVKRVSTGVLGPGHKIAIVRSS